MRYLAKQGQAFIPEPPEEILIDNLMISDGTISILGYILNDNTRQIFSPDVSRTLIEKVDNTLDVELLDVIPTEFFIDVKRALLAKVNLCPTDTAEIFSGGSQTVIVNPDIHIAPVSDSSTGLQSFEVTLAEQQVTDQVKFTGIIPFDIMQQVSGQYFDYVYNMRVERVQQQGILFSCDCCSDIDALLFTQIDYTIPPVTWTRREDGKTVAEIKPVEVETNYPPASEHVKKIAAALGLSPVMQFDDFLSTVLTDELGGVTYNDLIRDVFGWSSRVPTQLINVFIRDGKLFVVERGHESHSIDISNADKTLPIVTKELVRTTWGSAVNANTNVSSVKVLSDYNPPTLVDIPQLDISDLQEELQKKPAYPRSSAEVHNSDGDDEEVAVESNYDYTDDNLISRSVTRTVDKNGQGTEIITTYEYKELHNGRKFLARERKETYTINGSFVAYEGQTIIDHTPLMQGQEHVAKADEGDAEDIVGQSNPDARVSPRLENQWREDQEARKAEIKEEIFNRIRTWAVEHNDLYKEYYDELRAYMADLDNRYKTVESETTVYGLSLYDSSFPIHNEDKLIQVTNALQNLNRKTRETVNVTINDFEHLIDFNDKIILDGAEYFLVSNTARTTPRIKFEQNLTLVRWY